MIFGNQEMIFDLWLVVTYGFISHLFEDINYVYNSLGIWKKGDGRQENLLEGHSNRKKGAKPRPLL